VLDTAIQILEPPEVVVLGPVPRELLENASWMPCEASWTSSVVGHRVASIRRRWLSICSCEISTLNGRVSVVVSIVVLMSAPFSAAT
jgi:hypothetical protein